MQPSPRLLCDEPAEGPARSRLDAETGIVFYNYGHPDYLMVKDDEPGLLYYLATLGAKEYVVYKRWGLSRVSARSWCARRPEGARRQVSAGNRRRRLRRS
jgi:hypothetical protein